MNLKALVHEKQQFLVYKS